MGNKIFNNDVQSKGTDAMKMKPHKHFLIDKSRKLNCSNNERKSQDLKRKERILKEENLKQHKNPKVIVIGEPNTYPQNKKYFHTTNEMLQECLKQLDKIKLEPFKKGKSRKFYYSKFKKKDN